MLVPVQMLKLCARLFNYLIWGAVDGGLGLWLSLGVWDFW